MIISRDCHVLMESRDCHVMMTSRGDDVSVHKNLGSAGLLILKARNECLDQELWGGRLIPSLMDGPRGPYAPKKSFIPEVVGKPPIIGLNWT